ncbi:hypothetical protein LC593_35865 [Nostoc sp. CHAB 5844]|nr:hypothetical protein [Nostoc sp. CHAB 5844]
MQIDKAALTPVSSHWLESFDIVLVVIAVTRDKRCLRKVTALPESEARS